ncbi:MAG TPA: hypothetical protein VJ259_03320 [Actinomycetota bacterium]|nr:hypothetical protein [Actinomycetota bacterium]
MREGRSGSPAEPGWGWLGAISLLLALIGIFLLFVGLVDSALGGLSGERPEGTAFVAGAVCGLLSVLAGVVGWLKTKGRGAVRAWPVFAGLIGVLVLVVGAWGGYENRARPAAECRNWDPPPAGSPTSNVLTGVAATSASDAWAVGRCSAGDPDKTFILHWDGSTWERQPSPNVGWGINTLDGVAAISPSDAWAVGQFAPEGGTSYRPLILHWDGTGWTRQPTPDDGQPFYSLRGAAATSSSDAWAVGPGNSGAVILHWDGTAWTHQAVPELGPGIYPSLFGVAATSASDAWAVGSYGWLTEEPLQGVIFHWDGVAWTSQPIPHVGTGGNFLSAVTATSPSNAWAVGWREDGTGQRALILHWDGKAWTHQPSPEASIAIGSGESLNGVAAASPSNAWAVGTRGQDRLVLCWNGSTWEERSSSVGTDANILNGVAALSPSRGLAVGINGDGTAARALVAPCR